MVKRFLVKIEIFMEKQQSTPTVFEQLAITQKKRLKLLHLSGRISIGLACLAFAAIVMLAAQPVVSQAVINNEQSNQLTDNGKIVNQGNGLDQQRPNAVRSGLVDNIFNIPIQTLKAVNDLVQSIAGNLQAAGAGSFFRTKTDNTRNINVNIDDDNNDQKEKN
ncbi:uncharacterized protein LOC128736423 [Sabethes cyaneus]|uniref:uncharacterized protein LOC128736423 n=1 Tax=Sabethes cyaneus TaxID=53552 RepID=UPI00237E0688|nr:uncharacterized protein LOC128736423 [Sabethes cyaneus]